MKLHHPLLVKPITWQEGRIPVLVAESPQVFQRMVFTLSEQAEGMEGSFILSANDDPLDCAEHLHVIRDYVFLSMDSRKLQNRFLAHLQGTMAESLLAETESLNGRVGAYLAALAARLDYPVSFTHGDYASILLKALKFQPILDGRSPLERLMQYFDLFSGLFQEQCFVLVSAKTYFAEDALQQLYKMAAYQKWNLLLLESRASPPLPPEDCCIVDSDLCELRLDFPDQVL